MAPVSWRSLENRIKYPKLEKNNPISITGNYTVVYRIFKCQRLKTHTYYVKFSKEENDIAYWMDC